MIRAFFEPFGYYTPSQLENTQFYNLRFGGPHSCTSHNLSTLIRDIPVLSLITGSYNLCKAVAYWYQTAPVCIYDRRNDPTDDTPQRYIAYKIGKIVLALLQILQICVIADLLVTMGRAICGAAREEIVNHALAETPDSNNTTLPPDSTPLTSTTTEVILTTNNEGTIRREERVIRNGRVVSHTIINTDGT